MMDTEKPPTRRTLVVSAVIAAAFIGFFVGTRPSRPSASAIAAAPSADDSAAPLARSNEELASNPWSSELLRWSPARGDDRPPVTTRDRAAYEAALQKRRAGRAFEGAPPTIPHPAGQGSAKECRVCHDLGARIGNLYAPPMSHPPYAMCTQCHVAASQGVPVDETLSAAAQVESNFEGVRSAVAPLLMMPGAPPQIPHPSFMRESCNSCHGPAGTPGLQTSHPERVNCVQCHAPAALVDQQPVSAHE